MQVFKPGNRAPIGEGQQNALRVFRVFVACPRDCEVYRSTVQKAVSRVNGQIRQDWLLLDDIHWRVDGRQVVTLSVDSAAQQQIVGQLGRASDAQIVLVLFNHTKGSGYTLEELEDALAAETPKPKTFVYRRSSGPVPTAEQSQDEALNALNEFTALGAYLESTLAPIETFASGFKDETDLEESLFNDLSGYLQMWSRYFLSNGTTTDGEPKPRVRPAVFERDLEAYRPSDTNRFFGRETEIEECRKRLLDDGARALKVVGPSGVGKSSFARAGLLPSLSLDGADWPSLAIRPRRQPFSELANALLGNESASGEALILDREHALKEYDIDGFESHICASPARLVEFLSRTLNGRSSEAKLVLYIDQFEELLVRPSSANQRIYEESCRFAGFLSFVLRECHRFVLVTSIREDRDRLNELEPWAELDTLMQRFGGVYPLREPDRDCIEMIITQSLNQGGIDIERDLLRRLGEDVNAVREEFGNTASEQRSALPLLSAALFDLGKVWDELPESSMEKRERRLTKTLYDERVGGLHGVMAKRAQEVFDQDENLRDQDLLNRLFLMLVRVDQFDNPVRRSQDNTTLDDNERLRKLVELLANKRILRTERDRFELIADVTFEAWPELRIWIAENKKNNVLFEISELEYNADRWVAQGRPDAMLIDETRLLQLEAIMSIPDETPVSQRISEATPSEAFIRASRLKVVSEILSSTDLTRALSFMQRTPPKLATERKPGNEEVLEKYYFAMFPEHLLGRSGSAHSEVSAGSLRSQLLLDRLRTYFRFDDLEKTRGYAVGSYTLAHFAALAGKVPVLQRFAEFGVDFASQQMLSDRGRLPFEAAIQADQVEVAKWLLDNAQQKRGIVGGLGSQIRQLLVNRADEDGWFPLHAAAAFGSVEMLEFLLKEGADPTAVSNGTTAFLQAIISNDEDKVTFFLRLGLGEQCGYFSSGPEMKDGGNTALHFAARHNAACAMKCVLAKIDVAEVSREEKPESVPNSDFGPPGLALAPNALDDTRVGWGNRVTNRSLSIDTFNDLGLAPIHTATMYGSADCISLLLEKGVSPETTTRTGEIRPLMLALANGHWEIVDQLLSAGGQTQRVSSGGMNLLHYLAQSPDDDPRLVPRLCVDGVNAYALHEGHEMPVVMAIKRGSAKIAAAMIRHAITSPEEPGLARSLLDAALDRDLPSLAAEIVQRFGVYSPWHEIRPNPIDPERSDLVRLSDSGLRARLSDHLVSESGSFKLPPLFTADWRVLDVEESLDLIARAAKHLPLEASFQFDRFIAARALLLPFYNDAMLYEVVTARGVEHAGSLHFIEHSQGLTFLSGTSPPIHELNANLKIDLRDKPTAQLYLEFFSGAVWGDEGPFRIIHTVGECLEVIPNEFHGELKEPLNKTVRALWDVAVDTDDEAMWRFCATVSYSNALFVAEFEVFENGMVEMKDDWPVASALPTNRFKFERGLRWCQYRPVDGAPEFDIDRGTAPWPPESEIQRGSTTLWATGDNDRLVGDALVKTIRDDLSLSDTSRTIEEWRHCRRVENHASDEAVEYLLMIEPVIPLWNASGVTGIAAVRSVSPPYAPEARLVEALAHADGELVGVYTVFLSSDGQVVLMDGTRGSFDRVWASGGLLLADAATVSAYVDFHFYCLASDGSGFAKLRMPNEDCPVPNTFGLEPKEELLEEISEIAWERDAWRQRALVQHRDDVSLVDLALSEHGAITLENETFISKVQQTTSICREGLWIP